MSATWSLTYLQTNLAEQALFQTLVKLFHADLKGKLYGWDSLDAPSLDWKPVRLEETVVEWFDTPERARMITDALIRERMANGMLLYPQHNGLFTIADSVIQLGDIYNCARARRAELAERLKQHPDPDAERLFHHMQFLNHLTGAAEAEAAHIFYERNPAGGLTGVHFYRDGQFVDEFYAKYLDGDDHVPLIELPQHPEILGTLLGKRFAFLLNQPVRWNYDDGEDEVDVYFDAEYIGLSRPDHDPFGMCASDLYVPFWEEDMLPIGAIYEHNKEFPQFFLSRYAH